MLWIDRLRLGLRPRWDRVDATFVSSRRVKRRMRSHHAGGGTYEIREYLVDVPGRDGGPAVRLSFEEQSSKVRGPFDPGDVVPVAVNRRRTKAMFDLGDPRIDQEGVAQPRRQQTKQTKRRDDARFEAKRDEPPSSGGPAPGS